jgi:hypothetical protein
VKSGASSSGRIPHACPACHKTLFAAAASRPEPTNKPAAKGLYVAAATATVAIYAVVIMTLRELLKVPIGEIGDSGVVLYRMPPTWIIGLIALPIALVPGFAIGWMAARVRQELRVRCWNCGWAERFPVGMEWEQPRETKVSASSDAQAFEVIADDVDPWKECTAWAYAEIRGGRLPEDVEADLVAQGWPRDDVEGMVERCRREARGRG